MREEKIIALESVPFHINEGAGCFGLLLTIWSWVLALVMPALVSMEPK